MVCRTLPLLVACSMLTLCSLPMRAGHAARRRPLRTAAPARVLHMEAAVLKIAPVGDAAERRLDFVQGWKRVDLDSASLKVLRTEAEFGGERFAASTVRNQLVVETTRPGTPAQRTVIDQKTLPQLEKELKLLPAQFGLTIPAKAELLPQREKLLGVWCRVEKSRWTSEDDTWESWYWTPEDPELRWTPWLKTMTYRVVGDEGDETRELVSGEIILSLKKTTRLRSALRTGAAR